MCFYFPASATHLWGDECQQGWQRFARGSGASSFSGSVAMNVHKGGSAFARGSGASSFSDDPYRPPLRHGSADVHLVNGHPQRIDRSTASPPRVAEGDRVRVERPHRPCAEGVSTDLLIREFLPPRSALPTTTLVELGARECALFLRCPLSCLVRLKPRGRSLARGSFNS